MNILSVTFIFFLITLFIMLWLLKKESMRQNILLVASYIFYAYADIRFLPILLLQTVTAYCSARVISTSSPQSMKKRVLVLGITLEIGVLAIYKYSGMLVGRSINIPGGV